MNGTKVQYRTRKPLALLVKIRDTFVFGSVVAENSGGEGSVLSAGETIFAFHKESRRMEPVLLALLCADRVITEERTKKRSIIGTFNNFWAQNFPATFPPWFVYLAFTNVAGEHNIVLNVANPSNNFNLFSANATIKTENPTAQIEFTIPVMNVVFPESGKYEVHISIDGKTFASRLVSVGQVQSAGGVQ